MAKFKTTIKVDGKEKTVTRTATNPLLIKKMEAALNPDKSKKWERLDKEAKEGGEGAR
ncbi:hypothetical protein LJC60_01085 [Ruminococcaceae bacterium OttesenSCG-928-D13]|nr:hypothetical protein [Ruminococcaceae bacterium OttesenSCG-928-D13]